jgi:glycosyltransferase involved in cell wall biosynthesis
MKPVIAFVINSIGSGGAERALARIVSGAPSLSAGFSPHLVLLDDEPDAWPIGGFDARHVIGARRGLARSIAGVSRIIRAVRPALVVSFLVRANVASVVAARVLGRTPVILCERMHLSSHLHGRHRGARRVAANALPRLLYRHADLLLGVSRGVTEDLVAAFAVPAGRARTIYNPYDLAAIRRQGAAEPDVALPPQFMLAMGRLTPAKDMAGLIRAFAASGVGLTLVVLGEGEERPALEALAAALGVADRVRFLGYRPDPFPVVARASYYVSASRNEGFPNAMVEAMALGVPVIATDCPSGPAEILAGVTHAAPSGVLEAAHGLLTPVGDPSALAEAMRRMTDPARRAAYAKAAAARAGDFSIETIAADYWRAFAEVAGAAASS